jgi:hypothetical protein
MTGDRVMDAVLLFACLCAAFGVGYRVRALQVPATVVYESVVDFDTLAVHVDTVYLLGRECAR